MARYGGGGSRWRDKERVSAAAAQGREYLRLPGGVLDEARREAKRLDRSISYIFQWAWKIAKAELAKLPTEPRDTEV